MRRGLLALALVSLLAAPAVADLNVASVDIGTPQLRGQVSHTRAAGQEIYQNLTPVGGYGGQGLDKWVIDDMVLDYTLAGGDTILDTVSFSLYYSSTAFAGSTIDSVDVDVGFWVDDLANGPGTATTPLLGGFSLTLDYGVGQGLAPGYYSVWTITGVGIDLGGAPNIMAGTQYTGVTGTGFYEETKLGQIIADPPTIGSSGDFFYNQAGPGLPDGNGNWSWFGGAPHANFLWEMTVPEPGSLSLLGIGALVLLRRRR
jgi:hypothetical protein